MKDYLPTSGKANNNSDKVIYADNINPTLEDYVIIKEPNALEDYVIIKVPNAWGADYYYRKLSD